MRVYRLLLRAYPRSFREEYGREMEDIFRTRLRDAGTAGRSALWLEAISDVALNAPRVHLDQLAQDIRAAARSLSHARGFALTAILVAALGTGATTTSFSVADHVLVRPLPFPDSDRLVMAWQDQSARGYSRMELSPPNYLDWKARSSSFEGFAAFNSTPVNLVGQGQPERLDAAFVTPDLFAVLGVQPVMGRALVAADASPQDTRAAVLSDAVWRAKFGAADVLGRPINVDGTPHVIVGVMPPGFQFPTRDADVWLPLVLRPDDDRDNVFLRTVARLKPGVSLDEARSELRVIAAQLEREYPQDNAQTSAALHLLRDQVTGQQRTLLITLVSASLCLLLIACLNLANLLLARTLVRQRELAVRSAMGAGRDRLVRQLLVESFSIALIGGVAGVILALIATPLVARLVPTAMPIPDAPSIDLRMLGIAALLTFTTALGFGVMPALGAMRHATASTLRDTSRTGSGRSTERWRAALVIAEIAATVVLLVASGLLGRALWNVQQVDPGFRAEQVLTARTVLPFPAYAPTERRQQFYDRVLEGVRALPGVTNAAYASFLPMVMRGGIWAVMFGGPDNPPAGAASLRLVTPDYFATMGIPLLQGRDVSASDTMQSPRVAVVSASFAKRHWPNQDPIGQRFFVALFERTVVGVVGDVRVRGLERESEPQVYLPSRQVPDGGLVFYAPKDLVVRATVPPETLVASIRNVVSQVDPNQPLSDVQLLADIVAADSVGRRTQFYVVIGFAAVAFVLAGVGVHGLLAFAVASRTRDIGVRIALGARPSAILTMVLKRGVLLSLLGVTIGVLAALATARFMQSLLVGVTPADAAVFSVSVGLVVVMTLAGALLPARRATSIDPIAAIRAEP
jgi:predicted permease